MGIAILLTVCASTPAEGQGLLRRLGNRIRGSAPQQYRQPIQTQRQPSSRYSPNGVSRLSPRANAPQTQSSQPANAATGDTDNVSRSSGASLGIVAQQVTTPVPGVQIVKLLPESKLQSAGLRRGDILVSLDGVPTPSLDEMGRLLEAGRAGQTSRVRIVRGRTAYDANVQLIASTKQLPDDTAIASKGPAKEPGDDADIAEVEKLGLALESEDRSRGIVVGKVEPGSIAAVSGVQVGDQIVSLDGRMLRSAEALNKAVNEKTDLSSSKLQIVRNDRIVVQRLRDPSEVTREAKPAATAKAESKSTTSGLGSMLGGLFGGSAAKPKAARQDAPSPPAPTNAAQSKASDVAAKLPSSSESASSDDVFESPIASDLMAFGDDEPIDSESFNVSPPERDLD